MRNEIILQLIVFLMIFHSNVFADSDVYWDYDIPIYKNAQNVSIKKDNTFFGYSISYDLKIKDTYELLEFYTNFFRKKGWSTPIDRFGNDVHMPLKWNGTNFNWDSNGLPEFVYTSYWNARDMDVHGVLRVVLTGFSGGQFDGKVDIVLSPKIDMTPIYEFQEKLLKNPQNIFLLSNAVQGNPFSFDTFRSEINPNCIKNEIVKEYYIAVKEILSRYREFYLKYINKKGT